MVFRTHLYHLSRLKLLFLCAAALTGCDDKELINPGGRAISFSVADTGFPADTDGTRTADSAPRHHSQPLSESGLYLRTTVEPMQPVTRAVPDDFRGFGVFAYMDNDLFMNNTEVTSEDGENWEYNTMYWPTGTYTMKFFAYAPYKDGFNIPVGGTISYDITQPQYDLMAATPQTYTAPAHVNLSFEHLLTKVIIKTADASANTQITSISFSNISTSGTYTLGEGWTSLGTSTSYSYEVDESESEFVFMMLPQDFGSESTTKISITLSDGTTFTAPLHTWPMGKVVTYTLNRIPDGYVDFDVVVGDNRIFFADKNLGAKEVYEYGDYYAWGETEVKEEYKNDNYKYFANNTMTKYNATDNLSILESEDDAASIKLGKNYRIPTIDEWEELLEKCHEKYLDASLPDGTLKKLYTDTYNSKKGLLVWKGLSSDAPADSDPKIFLPAAGCYNGNVTENDGVNGNYWSSTLVFYNSHWAVNIYFPSNGTNNVYEGSDFGRIYGASVRPIYVIPQ